MEECTSQSTHPVHQMKRKPEKETTFDKSLFPYIEYNHFGMEWIGIVDELEWSYSNFVRDERSPLSTCFDVSYGSTGTTSAKKSKVYLFESRNVFSKGEYIHVVIEAFDEYGNRRWKGGDFFQGVMYDEVQDKRTPGTIFDYGNGTYSVYFYAAWAGKETVSIKIWYTRETIIYSDILRSQNYDRSGWIGAFRISKMKEEEIQCSTEIEGIWENKCEFTNTVSLGKVVMICDKPSKLSCDDLWKTSHNKTTTKHTSNEAVSYFKQINKEQNVEVGESNLKVTIIDKNIKLDLPPCGPDLPIPLSNGYWIDNITFVPMMCRSQQWSQNDIEKCLYGKTLHFSGGSTIGQLRGSLEEHKTTNCTIRLNFVAMRFGVPQVHSGMVFEADLLDSIPQNECISGEYVLVMNFYVHFSQWPTRSYLERLYSARLAMQRFLKRCPQSILIIKLSHPLDSHPNAADYTTFANHIYYDMSKMIRRVLGGIGIRFLDIWDLAASSKERNKTHMNWAVIKQELFLLLSYICPHMVK
ncbi:NXPE family member 4-like [Glandiceps talaboti]